MSKTLVWTPTTHDAAFYLEEDYALKALTIHAVDAPTNGDLIIDILDDGKSIMVQGEVKATKLTKTDAVIWFGTHSTADFTLDEEVEGGSSSSKADVLKVDPGQLTVVLKPPLTNFEVGETVTGASSGATGVVDALEGPQEYYTPTSSPRTSEAVLAQGQNINSDAEDFGDNLLREGSLITLKILEQGGANKVSVQLELESLGE